MINIAIVDDEEILLEKISNLIRDSLGIIYEINIDKYRNAESFLNKTEKECMYDVVFSDIQMNNMDGIHFGRVLREQFPNVYLIFLTSYAEYAVQSYALEAYQYILKQEMYERLPIVLEKVIKLIVKEKKSYRLIGISNDTRKIYFRDIIYISKVKGAKYVEYVTILGTFRERISLDRLLKEMNAPEFILVERGYVVNIRHIVRLKSNAIFLKNGEEIVVSRSRFLDVKGEIHKYWEKSHG